MRVIRDEVRKVFCSHSLNCFLIFEKVVPQNVRGNMMFITLPLPLCFSAFPP
uniref:Uncharacterized protein n=1 Tax=Anguilla anguilla TaxID=7936 RepID=A0A0E9WGJ1_ANGAN